MVNQVKGGIDIVPPLAWSEVSPTGFMVLNTLGTPVAAPGRMTTLVPTEELVIQPEGTLRQFTFARLEAASPDIADQDREAFRAEVQATIAAFPSHTFGGVERIIRFRGDQLDDNWRVGLAPDGVTVRRQIASLTWVNA